MKLTNKLPGGVNYYKLKKAKFILIGLVAGILLTNMIGYAATTTPSNDVYYDNSNSTLESTTVQEALDELYCKVYNKYTNVDLISLFKQYAINDSSVSFSTPSSGTNVYVRDGTENDENPIYYYRGIANNNLIFAGFCWKIVRTTENGGLKLLYFGEVGFNNICKNIGTSSSIGSSAMNTGASKGNAYVGYMYGSTSTSATYNETHQNVNNSTVKKIIDSWYEKNMLNYTDKLETEVFCNDRSLYSGTGAGNASSTEYKGLYRVTNGKPTFDCPNKDRDYFTVKGSDSGNQALTYPVGLITADEVMFAGGSVKTSNVKFYMFSSESSSEVILTGTPAETNESGYWGMTSYVNYKLGSASNSGLVHPVVSLKSGYKIYEGNGTEDTPYIVYEDE
jgi:hypothetical protein